MPLFRGGFSTRGRQASSSSIIYQTNFNGTENPISESSKWINGGTNGLDWGDVQTSGGMAFGTNGHDFNDNTALLVTTVPNNLYIQSVARILSTPDPSLFAELEHRARSSLTAHVCNGYEIFYSLIDSVDAYVAVVRWNGPNSDFDYLNKIVGSQYTIKHGDVMRTEVEGNIIRSYKNSILMLTVDIVNDIPPGSSGGSTVYNSGKAGMGMDITASGVSQLNQFGWDSWEVGLLP